MLEALCSVCSNLELPPWAALAIVVAVVGAPLVTLLKMRAFRSTLALIGICVVVFYIASALVPPVTGSDDWGLGRLCRAFSILDWTLGTWMCGALTLIAVRYARRRLKLRRALLSAE